MKLTELGQGDKAVLSDFATTRVHQKLLAMGFSPGSAVVVVSKLPLNGNLHVRIGNRSLALRYVEAAMIEVEAHG